MLDFEAASSDSRMQPWLEEVVHPLTGTISSLRVPLRVNGTYADTRRPAPVFDQHTEQVLSDWDPVFRAPHAWTAQRRSPGQSARRELLMAAEFGIARLRDARTGRASSWDRSGRNADYWTIPAGETRVLAEIEGPGCITHIWMTQPNHYRECLLRFTWDGERQPSVVVPLGDFFGLGHGLVNSYQSMFFSASTRWNNRFNVGCALNCYLPMPFRTGARVELVNQSDEPHLQYFYVDYERWEATPEDLGYLHARVPGARIPSGVGATRSA